MDIKESFDNMYNNIGCFEYNEEGFTIVYDNFSKYLKWREITEIVAYKTDLFTFDRIEMQIVYGDKYFTINEELPGWYQFIIKLKEIFPSIPKEWDTDIIFPAFAENRIIIYAGSNNSEDQS